MLASLGPDVHVAAVMASLAVSDPVPLQLVAQTPSTAKTASADETLPNNALKGGKVFCLYKRHRG